MAAVVPSPPPPPPTLRNAGLVTMLVGLLALGAWLAFSTVLQTAPTWSSTTSLLIDQPLGLSVAEDPGLIEKLSRLRFKYAGVVGTAVFAEEVGAARGADGPVPGLSASVDQGSLLLHLTGTSDDADEAQARAADGAQALVDYVDAEQRDAGVPEESLHVLTVVTPATDPVALPTRSERLSLAGLAVGAPTLLIGLVLVLSGRRRQ